MPSVSVVRHGKGFRCVWREGGRDSKRHVTAVHKRKGDAMADAEIIRARLLAAGELRGRVTLTWSEVVQRWQNSRAPGRYTDEAGAYLRKLAWRSTADASALEIDQMPQGWQRVTKAVLRWAVRMLDQPVPPRALLVPTKRTKAKPKAPLMATDKVQEVQTQADGFSPGTGALVHLLATYGHRAESLVALTCAAYDQATHMLTLPVKGGDVVRHPVLETTHARLVALCQDQASDAPLFRNHLGKTWVDGRAFASWFNHTFGFGYYDLKRYAITRMLGAGLDAKTVASITGHRTVSLLLNTYARTNEERQRAALATLAVVTG